MYVCKYDILTMIKTRSKICNLCVHINTLSDGLCVSDDKIYKLNETG